MKLVRILLVLAVLGGLGWAALMTDVGADLLGLPSLAPSTQAGSAGKRQRKGAAEPVLAAEPAPDEPAAADGEPTAVPRASMVAILTRIEEHGRATGADCESIDVVADDQQTYVLGGRGEVSTLTAFFAALEQDPFFAGLTELRVWSEGEQQLAFEVDLLLEATQAEG